MDVKPLRTESDYDSALAQIADLDPPAIKLRMAQRGLIRKDLEKIIGGMGRVSEVMNRKRPLTIEMPAGSLIRPTTKPTRAKKRRRAKTTGTHG